MPTRASAYIIRERDRQMDKTDIRELAAETDIEAMLQAEWDEQDEQAKANNLDISDIVFIVTVK